jgi:hypothetical protein
MFVENAVDRSRGEVDIILSCITRYGYPTITKLHLYIHRNISIILHNVVELWGLIERLTLARSRNDGFVTLSRLLFS